MKTLEELEKSQDKILVLHYACTDVTKSPVIISSIYCQSKVFYRQGLSTDELHCIKLGTRGSEIL